MSTGAHNESSAPHNVFLQNLHISDCAAVCDRPAYYGRGGGPVDSEYNAAKRDSKMVKACDIKKIDSGVSVRWWQELQKSKQYFLRPRRKSHIISSDLECDKAKIVESIT